MHPSAKMDLKVKPSGKSKTHMAWTYPTIQQNFAMTPFMIQDSSPISDQEGTLMRPLWFLSIILNVDKME